MKIKRLLVLPFLLSFITHYSLAFNLAPSKQAKIPPSWLFQEEALCETAILVQQVLGSIRPRSNFTHFYHGQHIAFEGSYDFDQNLRSIIERLMAQITFKTSEHEPHRENASTTSWATPPILNEAQQKGYERLAKEAAALILPRLPKGGLVLIDGLPGIGKSTFSDILVKALATDGRHVVAFDTDIFNHTKEHRMDREMRIVKEGNVVLDEYRDLYRYDQMDEKLGATIDFMQSDGPADKERTFTLEDAYVRPGENWATTWTIRRGDMLLINADYVHYFSPLKNSRLPRVSLRLESRAGKAKQQYLERSRSRYSLKFIRNRSRYYNLAVGPSWEDYAQNTLSNINFRVILKGNPRQWTLREYYQTPILANPTDKDLRSAT